MAKWLLEPSLVVFWQEGMKEMLDCEPVWVSPLTSALERLKVRRSTRANKASEC